MFIDPCVVGLLWHGLFFFVDGVGTPCSNFHLGPAILIVAVVAVAVAASVISIMSISITSTLPVLSKEHGDVIHI